MASIRGSGPAGAIVRLAVADGSAPSVGRNAGRSGAFEFSNVAPGWYILAAGDAAKAVQVGRSDVDAGTLKPRMAARPLGGSIQILTVCEALDQRDSLSYRRVIIVGIFKSGMDETLRLDCSTELMTREVGWPSSIGLTGVSRAPDEFRSQAEKKRQQVLSSSPPESPLRPERVVGLYGLFVSLAGLTTARCCSAAVETVYPPARLFGVSETDLSVIR